MSKNNRKSFSMDITDTLGERLRTARETRGYTREQLSERSGVSERYIVAIENEGSIPRVPVLNDLLRGLGLSSDYIFYPENTLADPQLDQLIRLYHMCDMRERKVIIAVVNALIDSRDQEAKP